MLNWLLIIACALIVLGTVKSLVTFTFVAILGFALYKTLRYAKQKYF